tara:strand:+ start:5667 stop:6689 length:1023 start_codon:yes stop_codon:yes gene_type:complete
MKVLVTGIAGFIGFHFSCKLIKEGISIIGIDNLNDYYDVNLKKARLEKLESLSKEFSADYSFYKVDLENNKKICEIFNQHKPSHVVNLAAQAGVRYSIENPSAYIQSNLVGFSNIIEACRHQNTEHFIYASSSSVYGGNTNIPFSEKQGVNHPVSLYAATKRANELIAHTYSHLYDLPSTGLRFFTVYGPWGRPDMALFLFTKQILKKEPIKVFNNGNMSRSFTYIDDIIESLFRILKKPLSGNKNFDTKVAHPDSSWSPFRIFNIGSSEPRSLIEYIDELENCLGLKAEKIFLEIQPGDVPNTAADTSSLEDYVSYKPTITIKEGIGKFVDWYKKFYNV